MKIALVDDDERYLEKMAALCREYGKKRRCPVETLCFTGGAPFLAALERGRFSMVFLDIYMADLDGITVARALRETDPQCLLVFLTSSRDFMPQAFSCHAFDYISKPLDAARVERVLDDAGKLLPTSHKYMELTCDRKSARVLLRDIVYAVTDAHYLRIALADGACLRPRMTVTEFLSLAGEDPRFILANRGVVLNVQHIRSFGDGCCVMEGGVTLPLRVKDAGLVEQAVMDYNFEMIRQRQNRGRNEG